MRGARNGVVLARARGTQEAAPKVLWMGANAGYGSRRTPARRDDDGLSPLRSAGGLLRAGRPRLPRAWLLRDDHQVRPEAARGLRHQRSPGGRAAAGLFQRGRAARPGRADLRPDAAPAAAGRAPCGARAGPDGALDGHRRRRARCGGGAPGAGLRHDRRAGRAAAPSPPLPAPAAAGEAPGRKRGRPRVSRTSKPPASNGHDAGLPTI